MLLHQVVMLDNAKTKNVPVFCYFFVVALCLSFSTILLQVNTKCSCSRESFYQSVIMGLPKELPNKKLSNLTCLSRDATDSSVQPLHRRCDFMKENALHVFFSNISKYLQVRNPNFSFDNWALLQFSIIFFRNYLCNLTTHPHFHYLGGFLHAACFNGCHLRLPHNNP